MSISRMLHGAEVNDYSSKAIKCMEDTHWEVAKSIQWLNHSTSNVPVLPSINWVSIEETIRKSIIDFLYRILLLDADNIYKKVAILRVFQCLYKQIIQSIGPTCRVLQSALCCDMLHLIIYAIENCGFCNIKNWKFLIKLVMLYLG